MFNKGDLVLIVGADTLPVQGVVVERIGISIVKVLTTAGTRTIYESGLRLIKRAAKVTLKVCEAATDLCRQMECPHAVPHEGEAWDCGHTRFNCQR